MQSGFACQKNVTFTCLSSIILMNLRKNIKELKKTRWEKLLKRSINECQQFHFKTILQPEKLKSVKSRSRRSRRIFNRQIFFCEMNIGLMQTSWTMIPYCGGGITFEGRRYLTLKNVTHVLGNFWIAHFSSASKKDLHPEGDQGIRHAFSLAAHQILKEGLLCWTKNNIVYFVNI